MRHYFGTVEDSATGRPIAGASIYVRTAPGGTNVTLYESDEVTTKAQPLVTDSDGFYSFYVADGEYCLQYYVGGTLLRTIDNVSIGSGDADAAAASATAAAASATVASDAAAAAVAAADEAVLSAATAEAVSGPTYASTAAGLAATVNGEAFAVDAGGGLVSIYLNSAGSAVLQRTMLTMAYLSSNTVTSPRFEGTTTTDGGTPDAVFRVNRTHTLATSPHSFRDQTVFSPSSAGIAAASFDAQMVTAGAQNKDHIIAFQARNTHAAASGTLTDHLGFGSYPRVEGTATNIKHFEVQSFVGGGTVTNEYGLYIGNLTGGATNKYAIYVANNLGSVYLAAPTQVLNNDFSVGNAARMFIGPGTSTYPGIAYNYNHKLNQRHAADVIQSIYFNGSDILFRSAPTDTAGSTPTFTELVKLKTDTSSPSVGAWYPTTDNRNNLGLAALAWKNVYTVNAVIVTSDTRLKVWRPAGMTAAEIDAAFEIASLGGFFRWIDGDRQHFGFPAQEVARVLMKHGLEREQAIDFPADVFIPEAERPSFGLGFVGFDTWEADDDRPAGNRFTLRIEPLNAFITSAIIRRIAGA